MALRDISRRDLLTAGAAALGCAALQPQWQAGARAAILPGQPSPEGDAERMIVHVSYAAFCGITRKQYTVIPVSFAWPKCYTSVPADRRQNSPRYGRSCFSHREIKLETAARFAHVLLFECPQCGRPLASACASIAESLEQADAHWFSPHCHCGWSGNVIGLVAIKHWVEPWASSVPVGAGSCDGKIL